jgi:hypothetical protein
VPIEVVHATAATAADDPYAEINKDEWNEPHSLTGFGTAAEADVGDFDAAGTAAAAVSAQVAKVNTHIAGLELTWVSATAVTVGIGAAYVESVGDIVQVTSPIALTSISLGNSVWGYVYLKADGTAECVTTAPAAPYAGKARSKTSDNTRRFLFAVRTDGSGNIYRFLHDAPTSFVAWPVASAASPFRILSNGQQTTNTTTSAATVMPPQALWGLLKWSNTDTVQSVYHGPGDITQSGSTCYHVLAAGVRAVMQHPVDSSQRVAHIWSGAPSGGAYCDVLGFWLPR